MTRISLSTPRTRSNESSAEAETRLLIDEEAAAETVLAEDLPDLPVGDASASAEPSDSDSADALDDDEDDRTQLVPRSETQTAADSETPKATRVLDPNAAAARSRLQSEGGIAARLRGRELEIDLVKERLEIRL